MKRLGSSLALILILILALTSAAASAEELLRPTGPHAIGRITFEWRDPDRVDELASPPGPRAVRVHVFYPARIPRGVTPGVYHPDLDLLERYTDKQIKAGYLREDFGDSYATLMRLRGHALPGLAAASSPKRFPVVVFSHGGGIQVLFYSALIEELASHGYVVAAVEHPYDADLVFLSNGRVLAQKEWERDAERTPAERAAFHRRRQEVDARDNSFVLDQLERISGGGIPSPLRGRLDLSRASAVGHSLGGKAAVVSCGIDDRWHSCVNLDGGLDPGETYPKTRKPVLALLGGPSPIRLPIESEEGFRKRRERNATAFFDSPSHKQLLGEYAKVPRGTIAYVVSPGFSHFSYYDLLRPEAVEWGGTPERHRRNLEIIRKCLLTFLETNDAAALRRIDAQLLIVPTRP